MTQRPEAYEGWIAMSPSFWVGEGAIAASLDAFFEQPPTSAPFYYTSLGAEEGNEMSRYFARVGAQIDLAADPAWNWSRQITPFADHGSNPPLSLPAALRAYWTAAPPP
jgi:predicted alpha/beta superfamily hydrolase